MEAYILEKKQEKVSQIRKKEILDAAKKVFLRKGFADTVMEDIITQILHDLMR